MAIAGKTTTFLHPTLTLGKLLSIVFLNNQCPSDEEVFK